MTCLPKGLHRKTVTLFRNFLLYLSTQCKNLTPKNFKREKIFVTVIAEGQLCPSPNGYHSIYAYAIPYHTPGSLDN